MSYALSQQKEKGLPVFRRVDTVVASSVKTVSASPGTPALFNEGIKFSTEVHQQLL